MRNPIFPIGSRHIAVLQVLAFLAVQGAPAHAESESSHPAPAQTDGAEATFARGVRSFKSGNATGALSIFAELSVATDSPNVQLYLGYCHRDLGNYRDAYQAFSRAVQQALSLGATKYEPTRMAAQEQLARLDLRVAKLTISLAETPADLVVRLDGVAVDPALLGSPLVVDPGFHRIEAEAQAYKPALRQVTLEGGGNKTVTLLLERKPPEQPVLAQPSVVVSTEAAHAPGHALKTMGLLVGGIAVVGWGVFAVAGSLSKGSYDRLQTECAAGCSDSAHSDDIDRGKRYQTWANAGLAVGVVGTAASATLLYLGVTRNASAHTSVAVGPNSATVTYQRAF
jgi:hypothetical protein